MAAKDGGGCSFVVGESNTWLEMVGIDGTRFTVDCNTGNGIPEKKPEGAQNPGPNLPIGC